MKDKSLSSAAIVEEMGYLSNNDEFIKATENIRVKNGLPTDGLKESIISFEATHYKTPNEKIQAFMQLSQDISELAKRCRAYKSKHIADFTALLNGYVFYNKIRPLADVMSAALPDFDIDTSSGRPVLHITLDFDTNLKEIVKILEINQPKIKQAQEKVGGKYLKPAKYFNSNIEIWNLWAKNNKTVPEILDMVDNHEINNVSDEVWSEPGLHKIIERTASRIKSSFN